MEKSKFAIAIDDLLRTLAIWLLSAICVRYVIKELYLIIIVATAITMLTTMLIKHYYAKKHTVSHKQQSVDAVMGELMVADRNELLTKLCGALNGKITQDSVISEGTVIFPYFYGKLSLEKLNYAYNFALSQNKKLLILCCEISVEVDKNAHLFSGTPVAILVKSQAYEFLDKYQILPPIKDRPKKKIAFFKTVLSKSKIKGYVLAALILLITATFSPYALLCIIFAAINITLSILCEIKGY